MRSASAGSGFATWLVAGGLFAAALLLRLVFLRYPQGDFPGGMNAGRTGWLVLVIFAALAAALFWYDTRPRTAERTADRNVGILLGVLCGCLWVLEISFNNFADLRLSTASARLFVDDGTWATVGVSILAAALWRARRGTFGAGLAVGFWSGLVSGLIACLMGLLLAVLWMPALLRDPLNVAEYGARVPNRTPGMAAYFAYETAAGAVGHLLVLGVAMGLLLGALGGALGRLFRPRS